jgi:methyltransferase (TIGR00027 family)
LFRDPLAHVLAGQEGRENGSGVSWVVVPRTRFMDDFLREQYARGVRQCVVMGAGMDARPFRLGLNEMHFFEVDQQTIFDVKEPLVAQIPLEAASRTYIPMLVEDRGLADALRRAGFDPAQPSAWILEGLMMYLNPRQAVAMADTLKELAAPGSALVHEGLGGSGYQGIVYCGAPFTGGSDDYPGLWKRAGFVSKVTDFSAVTVDRGSRCLRVQDSYRGGGMVFVTAVRR